MWVTKAITELKPNIIKSIVFDSDFKKRFFFYILSNTTFLYLKY